MHSPFRLMDLQQTLKINGNTETSKPDVNLFFSITKKQKDLEQMRVKRVECE